MDIFAADTDPSRDLPSTRKVEVLDGSPFLIERQDPFGFWHIRREHGQIPVDLQGVYTRIELAEQAVNTYIKTKMKPAPVKEKINDDEGPQVTNRSRPAREQRGSVSGG